MAHLARSQGCDIPILASDWPRNDKPQAANQLHSGIAISANKLVVATVRAQGRTLSLCDSKCRVMELDLACQEDFHSSMERVQHLFLETRITFALQRALAPGGGGMLSRIPAYRIESLVHLARGVTIERVAAHSLTKWFDRVPLELPACAHLAKGSAQGPMQRALIAAAYLAMMKGDLHVDGGVYGRA